MSNFYHDYLADAVPSFRNYKKLADRAIEQVSDEEFFAIIDAESNSLAAIVKHVAGNLHSRWRDFLTTDGEKPDRDRDQEFETVSDSRASLLIFWESGWETLFGSIEPLTEEDFATTIKIRGEPHSVVEAINRQLTHYSYHIGQIVFLAKHLKSTEWRTLSAAKRVGRIQSAFSPSTSIGSRKITSDRYRDRFRRKAKVTARHLEPSMAIKIGLVPPITSKADSADNLGPGSSIRKIRDSVRFSISAAITPYDSSTRNDPNTSAIPVASTTLTIHLHLSYA